MVFFVAFSVKAGSGIVDLPEAPGKRGVLAK